MKFADNAQTEPSTGDADEEDALTLGLSITILGIEPTVVHFTATSESVFVGSSDGRLLILSTTGQLQDVHALAESSVRPVMGANSAPVAAYSDDALFLWEHDRFRHIADVGHAPDGVGVWPDLLYAWDRERLDALSRTGQVVWSVEFSKNISSAVVQEGRLVCAAGVLTTFARAGTAM